MQSILFKILKILAKAVIKKYRPLVIGITGSVGKTSTKEAIFTVLKDKFKVRENIKNYNNEIGVPLTILGRETGKRSVVKWFAVIGSGLKLIFKKDPEYPNILVVEMGADKIGDIGYLLDIIPCDIGVVTAVSEAHLETFGSIENIIKEKQKIVSRLKESHLAVLNADDRQVMGMANLSKAKVLTFGFSETANFSASDLKISFRDDNVGSSFKVSVGGHVLPVFLPNVIGPMQVMAVLAAMVVASHLQMNLVEIVEALQKYQSPPGRTNLLRGIKGTLIIDDSYNASPLAAKAALDVLNGVKMGNEGWKIAVFGEMRELGEFTEKSHREVGEKATGIGVDMLIAVGEKARDIIRGAVAAGLEQNKAFYFKDNYNAGLFLQNKIKSGDVLLIKGSQGARMEQIVKELMADPINADKLLVRQGPEWKK